MLRFAWRQIEELRMKDHRAPRLDETGAKG
jgi:hypothetical protein